MATGEKGKEGESKGFAGLSSLISDVGASGTLAANPETARTQNRHPASPPPTPPPNPSAPTSQTKSQPPQTPPERRARVATDQPPINQPKPSSGGGWVIAVVLVVGFFWWASTLDSGKSGAPGQPPTRPTETMPAVGTNLVLSTAEIRYCVAEDMRMEGAKRSANDYSDSDVSRFNAMVADYNSRCGSFRYRSGALESAQRDIEPFRRHLQAEGAGRFGSAASIAPLPNPDTSRGSSPPAPDATVRAIQRQLNERGFEAGNADGLMGRATRAAIIAFQRNAGLVPDGIASKELLLRIESTPYRQPNAVAPASRRLSPAANETTPTTRPESGVREPSMAGLTHSEKSAIETACILKRSSGAAVYNQCLVAQLKELESAPREPSMTGLSYSEKSAIETACILKRSSGAASHNRCLVAQLKELESAPREPSMTGLSYNEKSAIETACILKRSSGAAAYNRCLVAQLEELQGAPRQPSLTGLSYNEKASIETACILKRSDGAAAYNRCLVDQLSELAEAPREPSMAGLSYSEKSAIEAACILTRSDGAAAHNRCLVAQLRAIGR
jgi:hypothetical protein